MGEKYVFIYYASEELRTFVGTELQWVEFQKSIVTYVDKFLNKIPYQEYSDMIFAKINHPSPKIEECKFRVYAYECERMTEDYSRVEFGVHQGTLKEYNDFIDKNNLDFIEGEISEGDLAELIRKRISGKVGISEEYETRLLHFVEQYTGDQKSDILFDLVENFDINLVWNGKTESFIRFNRKEEKEAI